MSTTFTEPVDLSRNIRNVGLSRPFTWLARGWSDFQHMPVEGALHGLMASVFGLIMVLLARHHFYLLSGALSGFLLVAPIIATGLYELSRRRAAGLPIGLEFAFAAWPRGGRELGTIGLMLMVIGTFWVGISMVLIALFVQVPITGMDSFLRHVVLAQDSHLFGVWMGVGGFFAAIVFAATVVSVPMLLDRDVSVLTALCTSLEVVGTNPITCALWATLIMVLTALAAATYMLGFVVVLPVLAHASWHAYVDLVDTTGLEPRQSKTPN